MKTFLLMLCAVLLAGAVMTGCKTDGSREFIPGRGWVPN